MERNLDIPLEDGIELLGKYDDEIEIDEKKPEKDEKNLRFSIRYWKTD